MSAKKDLRDSFCFGCHSNNTEIDCNKCELSYHHKCIGAHNHKQSDAKWVCGECNAQTCDTINEISIRDLNQLLIFSLKTVQISADYYFSSDGCVESDRRIVRQMSLKLIENKCKANEYKFTKWFVTDVKRILHNTVVKNMDQNLVENAVILVKKAKAEIIELEECPHCYRNFYTLEHSSRGIDNFFSVPCLTPHTLVWAHVRGHPFWPAKAIKTNYKSIFVRFFGTYEKGWVKEKNCYLMSKRYFFGESKINKPDVQKQFDKAVNEVNYYIDCVNKKFPDLFRYVNKRTMFSIDKMSVKLIPNDVMKSTNYVDSASNQLDFSGSSDMKTKSDKVEISRPIINQNFVHIREYKSISPKKRNGNILNKDKSEKKMKNLETETKNKIKSNIDKDISKNVINDCDSQKEIDNLKKIVEHLEEQIKVNNKLHEQHVIEIKRNSEQVLQKAVDEERAKHAQHFDEAKNKFQTGIFHMIKKHELEILSLKQKFDEQIKETKTKNWCINCSRIAILHCCTNTFYCSYECQSDHWDKHSQTCTKSNDQFSDEEI